MANGLLNRAPLPSSIATYQEPQVSDASLALSKGSRLLTGSLATTFKGFTGTFLEERGLQESANEWLSSAYASGLNMGMDVHEIDEQLKGPKTFAEIEDWKGALAWGINSVSEQIPNLVGQFLPALVATAVTKRPWVPGAIAYGTIDFMNTSEVYTELLMATGESRPAVAATTGGLMSILDMIVPMRVIGRMGKGTHFASWFGKQLKDPKKRIPQMIGGAIGNGVTEGTTEYIQTMFEGMALNYVEEHDLIDEFSEAQRAEQLESGARGALLGTLLGIPISYRGVSAATKKAKTVKDLLTDKLVNQNASDPVGEKVFGGAKPTWQYSPLVDQQAESGGFPIDPYKTTSITMDQMPPVSYEMDRIPTYADLLTGTDSRGLLNQNVAPTMDMPGGVLPVGQSYSVDGVGHLSEGEWIEFVAGRPSRETLDKVRNRVESGLPYSTGEQYIYDWLQTPEGITLQEEYRGVDDSKLYARNFNKNIYEQILGWDYRKESTQSDVGPPSPFDPQTAIEKEQAGLVLNAADIAAADADIRAERENQRLDQEQRRRAVDPEAFEIDYRGKPPTPLAYKQEIDMVSRDEAKHLGWDKISRTRVVNPDGSEKNPKSPEKAVVYDGFQYLIRKESTGFGEDTTFAGSDWIVIDKDESHPLMDKDGNPVIGKDGEVVRENIIVDRARVGSKKDQDPAFEEKYPEWEEGDARFRFLLQEYGEGDRKSVLDSKALETSKKETSDAATAATQQTLSEQGELPIKSGDKVKVRFRNPKTGNWMYLDDRVFEVQKDPKDIQNKLNLEAKVGTAYTLAFNSGETNSAVQGALESNWRDIDGERVFYISEKDSKNIMLAAVRVGAENVPKFEGKAITREEATLRDIEGQVLSEEDQKKADELAAEVRGEARTLRFRDAFKKKVEEDYDFKDRLVEELTRESLVGDPIEVESKRRKKFEVYTEGAAETAQKKVFPAVEDNIGKLSKLSVGDIEKWITKYDKKNSKIFRRALEEKTISQERYEKRRKEAEILLDKALGIKPAAKKPAVKSLVDKLDQKTGEVPTPDTFAVRISKKALSSLRTTRLDTNLFYPYLETTQEDYINVNGNIINKGDVVEVRKRKPLTKVKKENFKEIKINLHQALPESIPNKETIEKAWVDELTGVIVVRRTARVDIYPSYHGPRPAMPSSAPMEDWYIEDINLDSPYDFEVYLPYHSRKEHEIKLEELKKQIYERYDVRKLEETTELKERVIDLTKNPEFLFPEIEGTPTFREAKTLEDYRSTLTVQIKPTVLKRINAQRKKSGLAPLKEDHQFKVLASWKTESEADRVARKPARKKALAEFGVYKKEVEKRKASGIALPHTLLTVEGRGHSVFAQWYGEDTGKLGDIVIKPYKEIFKSDVESLHPLKARQILDLTKLQIVSPEGIKIPIRLDTATKAIVKEIRPDFTGVFEEYTSLAKKGPEQGSRLIASFKGTSQESMVSYDKFMGEMLGGTGYRHGIFDLNKENEQQKRIKVLKDNYGKEVLLTLYDGNVISGVVGKVEGTSLYLDPTEKQSEPIRSLPLTDKYRKSGGKAQGKMLREKREQLTTAIDVLNFESIQFISEKGELVDAEWAEIVDVDAPGTTVYRPKLVRETVIPVIPVSPAVSEGPIKVDVVRRSDNTYDITIDDAVTEEGLSFSQTIKRLNSLEEKYSGDLNVVNIPKGMVRDRQHTNMLGQPIPVPPVIKVERVGRGGTRSTQQRRYTWRKEILSPKAPVGTTVTPSLGDNVLVRGGVISGEDHVNVVTVSEDNVLHETKLNTPVKIKLPAYKTPREGFFKQVSSEKPTGSRLLFQPIKSYKEFPDKSKAYWITVADYEIDYNITSESIAKAINDSKALANLTEATSKRMQDKVAAVDSIESKMIEGRSVTHSEYGIGMIVSVGGPRDNPVVTVEFKTPTKKQKKSDRQKKIAEDTIDVAEQLKTLEGEISALKESDLLDAAGSLTEGKFYVEKRNDELKELESSRTELKNRLKELKKPERHTFNINKNKELGRPLNLTSPIRPATETVGTAVETDTPVANPKDTIPYSKSKDISFISMSVGQQFEDQHGGVWKVTEKLGSSTFLQFVGGKAPDIDFKIKIIDNGKRVEDVVKFSEGMQVDADSSSTPSSMGVRGTEESGPYSYYSVVTPIPADGNGSITYNTGLTPKEFREILGPKIGRLSIPRLEKKKYIHIVQNQSDVPNAPTNMGIKAVTRNGEIYFITNNIRKDQVKGVYIHEVGVHIGLKAVFGDYFNQLLESAKSLRNSSEEWESAFNTARTVVESGRQGSITNEDLIAEEAMGYFIENNDNYKDSFWQSLFDLFYRVKGKVKVFFGGKLNEQEIVSFIRGSVRKMREESFATALEGIENVYYSGFEGDDELEGVENSANDWDAKKRIEYVQKSRFGKGLKKFFDPFAELPQSRLFRKFRSILHGNLDEIETLGSVMLKEFDGLNQDENQELFDYFTTKDAPVDIITKKELRESSRLLKQKIESIADEGLIRDLYPEASKEQMAELKGAYLPRIYLSFILKNRMEGAGKSKRSLMPYKHVRKEFEQDLKDMWGEIQDVRYLLYRAITIPQQDIAITDYLITLSEKQAFVKTDRVIKLEEKIKRVKEKIKETADADELKTLKAERKELIDELKGIPSGEKVSTGETPWVMQQQWIKVPFDDNGVMRTKRTTLAALQRQINDFGTLLSNGDKVLKASAKENINKRIAELEEVRLNFFKEMGLSKIAGLDPSRQAEELDAYYNDKYDTNNYQKMPTDATKYGAMAGLWVRKEIYEDIIGSTDINKGEANLFQRIFANPKAVSIYKTLKVPLNPPTVVRNFVSNMVLLQLVGGVSFHRQPGLLSAALKELKGESSGKVFKDSVTGKEFTAYELAKRQGVSASTLTSAELKKLETVFKHMEKEGVWSILTGGQKMWNKISDAGSNMYQNIELLGKVMAIMDKLDNPGQRSELEEILAESNTPGLTIEDIAVQESNRILFDYSEVHPSVRGIRSTFLGAPFITFQVKVLPQLLKTAVKHPQRFIPYFLMISSMQALFGSIPFVDDDWDKLQRLLPEWARDNTNVFLPWKDSNDNWQAVDLSYFFPWTWYTHMGKDLMRGDYSKALLEGGIVGPGWQVGTAFLTGKDPWLGEQVIDPNDSTSDQVWDLVSYANSTIAPSWLTRRGLVSISSLGESIARLDPSEMEGKMADLVLGRKNAYGDQKRSWEQVLGSIVGLNNRSIAPQERSRQIGRFTRKIDKLDSELLRVGSDRKLSDKEKKRKRNSIRDQIDEVRKIKKEFQQGTSGIKRAL